MIVLDNPRKHKRDQYPIDCYSSLHCCHVFCYMMDISYDEPESGHDAIF